MNGASTNGAIIECPDMRSALPCLVSLPLFFCRVPFFAFVCSSPVSSEVRCRCRESECWLCTCRFQILEDVCRDVLINSVA